MKHVRRLISVSLVLGFVSALALLAECMALCDIAKVSSPIGEWYVVGVCMLVTAAFVIMALIALGFVLVRLSPEIQATRVP